MAGIDQILSATTLHGVTICWPSPGPSFLPPEECTPSLVEIVGIEIDREALDLAAAKLEYVAKATTRRFARCPGRTAGEDAPGRPFDHDMIARRQEKIGRGVMLDRP